MQEKKCTSEENCLLKFHDKNHMLVYFSNRVPVRWSAHLVVKMKSVFPTIKMTPYNASVKMATQENLAVSLLKADLDGTILPHATFVARAARVM